MVPEALVLIAAARRRAVAGRVVVVLGCAFLALVLGFVTLLVMVAGGGAQQAAEVAARTNCGQQSGGDIVTVADVKASTDLTAEQAENAATIASVAAQLLVPDYGVVIAIAVAWQESRLENVEYGDRDSLGLFQQRPSKGWGTPDQVTDPVLATRAFFGSAAHTRNPGLLDVPGWESMSLGRAAQAVQRSGDPTGAWYAKHELLARRILAKGDSGAGGSQGTAPAGQATPAAAAGAGEEARDVPSVRVVHANIPGRSRDFRGALRQVVSGRPDLVSLNEMSGRTQRQFTPAGYDSWRAGPPRVGPPQQAMSTAVLWRTDRWHRVDGGRVVLVRNGPQRWDDNRSANWVTVQGTDGEQVSMVSAHHMVNPRKYGPNRPLRQRLYRDGMAQLGRLVQRLSSRGPVFVAGDLNSQFAHNDPWGPRTTLARFGMQATMETLGKLVTHAGGGAIDYIFFQTAAAQPVRQWTARIPSDHRLVGADFRLQGGGGAPLVPGLGGVMCGNGLALDCPATPWPDLEQGLTPDALRVLRCVHQQFPAVASYAGVGDRQSNPGSSHETGRAVDAMIPSPDTTDGRRLGDRIADYVRQHARALGVTYVIWNERIWSVARADEGWRRYRHPSGADDATSAHRDHVHIDVFGNAAGSRAVEGPWAAPLQRGYTITARFGECSAHWSNCHTGLDFAAPSGTPVAAASAGTVVFAGDGGAYGNLVKVAHANGVETWYGHLSSIDVARGSVVGPGTVLGRVGSTGNSTGPHLHFEVRESGAAVDPAPFLESRGVAT